VTDSPVTGIAPDSLRRALADVFARPEYRWVGGRDPFSSLAAAMARFLAWLGGLEHRHPGTSHEILIGLVVAVGLVLAHLVYVLWSVTRPTVRTGDAARAQPASRLATPQAYRDRADALARAGRFTEALSQQFVAVLLELDRGHALTFDQSKTPAEYLGDARLDPVRRRSLGDLVARLYRHVFGAEPCDERAYQEFAAAAMTFAS
jgi:hypothetical protein